MKLVIRKMSRETYRHEIDQLLLSMGVEPDTVPADDDPSDCSVCFGAYFMSDGIFELVDTEAPAKRYGFVCAKCAFYPAYKIRTAWQWKLMDIESQGNLVQTLLNRLESEDSDGVAIARDILESQSTPLSRKMQRLRMLIECPELTSLCDASGIVSSGFVYLLGNPEGYCKIGRTVNLNSRLHSIGLQLPFKVELLHTIKVSDPVKAERFLHLKFKECRANGEWFLLSIEQINWFKSQTSLEGLY